MLRVDFVTLFPEVVRPFLSHSVLGRAAQAGLVAFRTANPRDYCYDRHSKVDDTPFGGEPGMLIKAEPIALAIEALTEALGVRRQALGTGEQAAGVGRRALGEMGDDGLVAVVLTDPAAALFTQRDAQVLSRFEQVVFLCGHYEGFDYRVKTELATHAFSIGDYVLTNGETPALVMADAVVRLLPGVLGNEGSLEADSHSDGLLSAPNYTRPEVWRGVPIPEVLKSGNHQAVERWRREQALKATRDLRPDLLARARLAKDDLDMLSS